MKIANSTELYPESANLHGDPEKQEKYAAQQEYRRGMQGDVIFELGLKNEKCFIKAAIAKRDSRQREWPHGSMKMHSMFRSSQ